LTLIVLSNCLVQWMPKTPVAIGYAGTFITIGAGYFIPMDRLFFHSFWVKALAATAILCLPVFFAGIIFIRSFALEGFRSEALGSNLLGALTGGMLESLSMWTGLRSLLTIAFLLYVAAWVALVLQQRMERFVPLSKTLRANPVGFGGPKRHTTSSAD